MSNANHRVSVIFRCRSGHEHPMCVNIRRQVPPELRCPLGQEKGYGPASGGGCTVPPNFEHLVERTLSDDFQESKRRGFVLVAP